MGSDTWEAKFISAHKRIEGLVKRTPMVESKRLSERLGLRVLLKLENQQVTGSFKARGAIHKLLSLTSEQRARGIVAASSGNHGAAVAYGANQLGCPATIYVPNYAADVKKQAIASFGAEVRVQGSDCVETEAIARKASEENGQPYVPPYNDVDVMAGQGTVAVEMLQDFPELDAFFVALGGGGLIGGMGLYSKAVSPLTKVIACSPEQSPAMHQCMEAGRVIDVPCYETLSDATAGGVEPGAITVDICNQVVDDSILVRETEISECMRALWDAEQLVVEGAAGVALAGAERMARSGNFQNVGIIVCGGNIGEETRRRVLGF